MATIPANRKCLHEIADELRHPLLFPRTLDAIAREIDQIAFDLWRRPAATRAPVASVPMTDELAESIRRDHVAHPKFTQQQIATRHGVTIGRVSEAISGKRT